MSKLTDMKKKPPMDKPNLDTIIEAAKVDGVAVEVVTTHHRIYTFGTVDSRHTPTRNKNIKVKQSVYDFIDAHTDGDQNVTLILNYLLEVGVATATDILEHVDLDIKGR
jgi:hypothetical protein